MKESNPREFAELIAASGAGIGQALSYLDPKKFAPIQQMRASAAELIQAGILRAGAQTVLPNLLRYSAGKRENVDRVLLLMLDATRDLILLKKSDDVPLSFYADREEAITLCDKTSLYTLSRLYEAIQAALDENQRNVNVRLILTKLALDAEWI